MVAGSDRTKSSSSKANDRSKSSGAGGGKEPSGGSATVRSIGGFPGGNLKQSTQYGAGTEIGGRRYGQALQISGGLVADWDKAGKLAQKIALDRALVGAALAQARKGLLGPTLNPPTLADIAKARAARGFSPIGRGLVDPFNAGVVAHWTNGGLAPNYQVGFDALGGMQFSQPINPAGMQRTNQAKGRRAGQALNASTIGVANTGTKSNPAQLAAAQNFGSFMRTINPYAQITSHGYLSAPNKVHARSIVGVSRKQPNEGRALADAIAGQPTTIGGFAPLSAGMSFAPVLPRNPIGGMSFTPGLPGIMPRPSRSRSPFGSGEPEAPQGIPGQPGREGAIDISNPAQFAESPLGQTFGRVGRGIGFGMRDVAQALRMSEDNKRGLNPIGRASPGDTQMAQQSPPLGRTPLVEVQQQRSALVGMFNSIMSRGGPKNSREQQFLMQIAQAIEALPRGGE